MCVRPLQGLDRRQCAVIGNGLWVWTCSPGGVDSHSCYVVAQSVRHLLPVFSLPLCVCVHARACAPARVCLHWSIWFLKHALSQKLIHILTINTYNESPGPYTLSHTAPELISCRASCAFVLTVKYLFPSIHTFEKNGSCSWTLSHQSNNRGGLWRL